jgi:hypothetical protein
MSTPNASKYPDTRENKIVLAKIKTRQDQINDISQIGPGVLISIGVLLILGVFLNLLFPIIGLIIGGIGWWWSNSRESERKKLENEIRELEAELQE